MKNSSQASYGNGDADISGMSDIEKEILAWRESHLPKSGARGDLEAEDESLDNLNIDNEVGQFLQTQKKFESRAGPDATTSQFRKANQAASKLDARDTEALLDKYGLSETNDLLKKYNLQDDFPDDFEIPQIISNHSGSNQLLQNTSGQYS
jgi:hypothetical protein